jgi:hypothetical protein
VSFTASHRLLRRGDPRRRRLRLDLWGALGLWRGGAEEEVVDCVIGLCIEEDLVKL